LRRHRQRGRQSSDSWGGWPIHRPHRHGRTTAIERRSALCLFAIHPRSRERKPLIAAGHDLLASAAIVGEAAVVGHEDPGFAGNIGAQVPAVGGRLQALCGDVLNVLPPRIDTMLVG
jgi:hypothetical protein